MPKTIAITPSWYWPERTPRVMGIPPFGVHELCVEHPARDRPGDVALTAGDRTLTRAELREEVRRAAAALRSMAGDAPSVSIADDGSADTVILFLASLAAGLELAFAPPGVVPAQGDAFAVPGLASLPAPNGATTSPEPRPDYRRAVLTIDGPRGAIRHSHRSLVANAINLSAFLRIQPGRGWVSALSLSTWEGVLGVLLPLYVGAPLVLAPAEPEGFARAIERWQPAHAIAAFETVSAATRDAKKAVKSARGTLDAMLLTTGGLFDPGERQRVGRAFECPALTLFGLPETGLLFASHPSWYLDESVGIPVTNAHVVPADPRTGVPIQALWELVESAEVTAAGPALMEGYADGEHPERFAGRRFRTRLLASQDANGMIYLLPPENRA